MTCHFLQNIFFREFGGLENVSFSRYWNVLFSGDNITTEICCSNYYSFGRFELAILGRLKYLIYQEGNMETKQMIPFFSSTFSTLTVLTFISEFENTQN